MATWNLLERAQEAYPYLFNDFTVISFRIENQITLKIFLDNKQLWELHFFSQSGHPIISKNNKTINIYCDRKLQIFEKQTENIILVEDENMFYLGSDFFIQFERIG